MSLSDLQELIDKGHSLEALAQLDRAAQRSPVPAGVQRLRGMALYSQGRMESAEAAFGAAMLQDPGDREATEMRGLVLYRMGRPDAAIPLLASFEAKGLRSGANGANERSVGSRGPVDSEYVLALCYIDTRRYDDARHAFAVQFGFPPDSASAYLLTARMLLRREYVPIAEQFARKSIELAPQMPLAHRLLGEVDLAGNHLDAAIQEFEAERKLNPLEPSVYDRLGDAYVRRGDLDRARASLQEAILLEPNATGPFLLLGKVLLKQGDASSAAGYLQHAREMDGQNFMVHSLLGQAYRQMGRVEEARSETAIAAKLQAASAPKLETVP